MRRFGHRTRGTVGSLSVLLLAAGGAVALVHPLQHLGFGVPGPRWTSLPVLGAVALAVLAIGSASGTTLDGGTSPLGRARLGLAAVVAWPVLAVALYPVALRFGVDARPLAALGTAALLGAATHRPTLAVNRGVSVGLAAACAAVLAVNLGLTGALALSVLLVGGRAVSTRRGAGDADGGRSRVGTSESVVGFPGLLPPALAVAAAGFWAPAPSLGIPYLAANPLALASVLGGTLGIVGGRVTPFPHSSGWGLPGVGALGGYLVGALWSGLSLAAAVGA